jgi:NADP-dependent 3-hydroxy acid dehydrogenase YdfG
MSFLHGKVVVLTGAASGIGEALAIQLARHGCRLLLADIDGTRLQSVAQNVRAIQPECIIQVCNVANEASIKALAARTLTEWGGAHILINNAGVALVAPVLGMNADDAHWLMDINFWGVVNGCRIFLPQLKARQPSIIVNISSIFAMVALPTQSIYSASKAAVRAFSDTLREEVRAEGIRVLCVHPGGIRTRIVEQARLGDISTIAENHAALSRQFEKSARTSADEAAHVIIAALYRKDTRLLIGTDALIGDWLYRLWPARAAKWFAALAQHDRKRQARIP